jgi:hypothetical protein
MELLNSKFVIIFPLWFYEIEKGLLVALALDFSALFVSSGLQNRKGVNSSIILASIIVGLMILCVVVAIIELGCARFMITGS